jgi:hypothetical protein
MLQPPKLKLTPPKPYQDILGQGANTWRPGVVSLVDPTRIPKGAVVQAKNCMQTQDGVWSTRWGSRNYGEAFVGPVTGIIEYTTSSGSVTTNWVMIMDNGLLKASKDGGAWTTLSTSHTYSTATPTRFVMFENKVLIANGIDDFSYYDLAISTLVQFTALTTPSIPTATLANLSSGTFPLYYQVTALSEVGETIGSPVVTANVDVSRDNWYQNNTNITTSSPSVTLSWTKIANAVGYNIYLSDGVSGVAYYLNSVGQPSSGTTVSYVDYGIDAVNDFIQVPSSDTTTAPKFTWLALSDNRLWACGDPNNPNRIYWAATGQYSQAFNAYLGGGWVDIMPGGLMIPTCIQEFRDGQGAPLTTILLAEPSGYGATYHVDLQSDQIGNTTIVVPAVMKAVGTFGTLSPFGVVETNQNLYFHSGTGGFFSTGSVPTLFNILATNEISILVRPDIKQLYLEGLAGLAGLEYDRKIFWSVPYNNPTNNRIMVYDLEKLNWNPYAFDFGVQQFLRYTDNSAITHLLAIPTEGNYLLEINENFTNDNNVPFESLLQTGLIHVSPDHIQFAHVTYCYYELGHPQGNVQMIISGTPHDLPLQQIEDVSVLEGGTQSDVGFSSYAFSQRPFSFNSLTPVITTDISVKERIRINTLLNNWQAQISSQDSNDQWTLNQFVIVGQMVPVADPNGWITN